MPSLMKARSGVLNSNIGGNALAPLFSTGALTIANAITDVTRLAGVEGDGATYPASRVGVWPAATNLVTNGGFETNTTGWADYRNGVISRITTDFVFGAASLQIVTPGGQANEGASFSNASGTRIAVSPSTTYTFSAWLKGASGTVRIRAQEYTAVTGGAFVKDNSATNVTLSGSKTLSSITFTTDGTTNAIWLATETNGSTQALTWIIDGVQLEPGSIATPYIETDGGTASRVAGSVMMPASVLDETQMWVAVRFRNGVNSSSTSSSNQRYAFAFGDDVNNNLRIRQVYSTDVWEIARASGGSVTSRSLSGVTYAIDDTETIVGYWTSSLVGLSRNGAAFLTAANTYIPTLSATYATIGSARDAIQPSAQLASAVLWFAAGKGTLTDADAALFNSWGNNDPLPHMFPRSAQLTFLAGFNGDGTAYRYAA